MKEIEFRGIDGRGNVFFGDLVHVSDKQVVIRDKYGLNHPVKSDSIAQLVGYGIGRHHVYEGDIVHFTHEGIRYEYKAQLTPCAVADNGCYIGADQIATREVEARL